MSRSFEETLDSITFPWEKRKNIKRQLDAQKNASDGDPEIDHHKSELPPNIGSCLTNVQMAGYLGLGEIRRSKSPYTLHISMCKQCLEKYEKAKLVRNEKMASNGIVKPAPDRSS